MAAERTAELEKRTKMVEQRLPAITARLSILRGEVTGSSRPVPSEIQLTSTGTRMTAEEHEATAETHLGYAEGHLQPSEEHLADAEVHLKLVKAHLTALVAMEPVEMEPPETAALPPPESVGDEASTDQDGATPEERDRSQIARPRAGPAHRGSGSDGKALRPGGGNVGCVLSASARIRRLTPWMNVRDSRTYQSPKGGRCSRSGAAGNAASRTVGIGRLAAGATVGSCFVGTTCWGWCRRQERTRLRAEGASSDNPKEKLPGKARAPLWGCPTRSAAGAAKAKESCRGDKQTRGVSPLLARARS